jgi:Uncharacterized conserved protein
MGAASSTPIVCSFKETRDAHHRKQLDIRHAVYDLTLPSGEPWLHEVKRGQLFRILDLEGNQAVDTLFYNSADPLERYSAQDTIRAQRNLYLSAGSVLMSNLGKPM